MTKSRMTDIAIATRQMDPFNWIQRLRIFNETIDDSLSVQELNDVIVDVQKRDDYLR